jgi:hypothetical protein
MRLNPRDEEKRDVWHEQQKEYKGMIKAAKEEKWRNFVKKADKWTT